MEFKHIMDIVVNYMFQLDKLFHKDKLLQQLVLQAALQVTICISVCVWMASMNPLGIIYPNSEAI